ncbi:hypothetical protein [Roseomonas sp. KE2513]|uniref:hypothetical protein n=1 Tax=Roseomonas sp. KE2513 TaxID=2479202 RepID=UPI001E3F81DC|nr:hypothetical protein [Roseomonas sp. KE2513]
MSATFAMLDISGLTVVPRRHYGRWVAMVAILVLLGALARAFAVGDIDWPVVAQFLTVKSIIDGLVNTVLMAIAAMLLGILLGVVTAVMRMADNPVLQGVAMGYAGCSAARR